MKGTYVEGLKEEVLSSPTHALSLIAAGEGSLYLNTLNKHNMFIAFVLFGLMN